MSGDQNLVQKQKIGATILDNRKAGAIAQEFLILAYCRGINMKRISTNIRRLKCPNACAAIKWNCALPPL